MTLICGIPDAGKTTYSMQYDNVIHFDTVKGGRRRRELVIEMVKNDPSICVEGVYEKAKDRANLVKASGERNTCIWLDTPLETCVDRELTGRHRHEKIVIWAAESFELPTFDEGWDEIIIIENEKITHLKKE